jgi:hypothetical protein
MISTSTTISDATRESMLAAWVSWAEIDLAAGDNARAEAMLRQGLALTAAVSA